MDNEIRNDTDITNVWQDQPVGLAEISLEEIRRKARKFEKRIFWRNLREYVAGAIVIACFVYVMLVSRPALIRTGCGLVIAGALFMMYMLHKKGSARTAPVELAFRTCVDFRRQELQRQRDLLQSVWSWYLLPFVPGMAIFLIGVFKTTMEQPNASAHVRIIVATFAFTAVVCASVFAGVGMLNQWGARQLQREIDALDELEKESE